MIINEQPTTPEIESLEQRKSELLSTISNLGLKIEEMDAQVSNHQALSLKSHNLITDIEEKQTIIVGLNKDIRELETKLEETKPLIEEINNLKKQKESISEEVSRLQSVIRVLQQEIVNFRSGKENVIKQLQEKHDEAQYKLFKIEETKREALASMQSLINAHK